jgi:SAM-dependent methyltransferase
MTSEEDALVQRVKDRLVLQVLYELQTGGGLAFDGPTNDGVEAQLSSIRAAVKILQSRFATAPDRVAQLLGRPALRILDLGAGSARWSIPFTRFRDVHVTALDRPEEAGRVEAAVAEAGLRGRVTIVAADAFDADPAELGTYDLVIVANVCHLFNEARNRELLQRIAGLVNKKGVLAIVDQVLELEPDWNRWAALYSVGVLHGGPGAFLFPLQTYERWLVETGFRQVESTLVCPVPPLTLITSRRSPG